MFRQLHQSRCFVIPSPWDLGSARLLAQLGFPALATTSAGSAWSLGRPDDGVSLEEVLAHFRSIAHGVDVPVNRDFEGGFAIAPDAVASNVAAATGTGIAGLSIEDSPATLPTLSSNSDSRSIGSRPHGGPSTKVGPASS